MGVETTAISPERIKSQWMNIEEIASVVGITPIIQGILCENDLWSADVDVNTISAAIEQIPTYPYIFEGTREGIQSFLDNGDQFVIWTQGESDLQESKFNTSKLSEITASHEGFNFISSPDKIPLLTTNGADNVIRTFAPENQPVLILDDKASNVYRATQDIEAARAAGILPAHDVQPITLAWMRHQNGRSRDKVPHDFASADEFMNNYPAVESLPDFFELRKKMHPHTSVTVLCDWDHTLFWTAAWRDEAYKTLIDALDNN